MNEYQPAKKKIEVSVGESIRILRELQESRKNSFITAIYEMRSTHGKYL